LGRPRPARYDDDVRRGHLGQVCLGHEREPSGIATNGAALLGDEDGLGTW
jgi:hypothetical protein